MGTVVGISRLMRACRAAFASVCSNIMGGAAVATGAKPDQKYANTTRPKMARPATAPAIKLTARIVHSSLLEFVLHDLATLHHELHALEFGHVGDRITCYCDHVCEFAFFHGAHAIAPTHHLGRHERRTADCLGRRHPVLHHV